MRFVVIIAQGGSGSPLILRLLNGVQGVRISGENLKSMDHLRAFADCYRRAEKNRHSDFYKLAWQAPGGQAQLVEHLRHLFIAMHGPGELIGFKEIRYGHLPYVEFAKSMDWLRELLPGVRLVFNTRRIETCLKSGGWALKPSKSRKLLKQIIRNFERYHDANPLCSYWMPCEELHHGSAVLRGMFEFLGVQWKREYEQPLDVVLRE